MKKELIFSLFREHVRYNDYKQIYSSILGYNCQAFVGVIPSPRVGQKAHKGANYERHF